MNFEFSNHALEQLGIRGISIEIAMEVLLHPQQVLRTAEQAVYQSIVNFEEGAFLVRVIVNMTATPNRVVTIYRTSKINKYYEGEMG